MYCPIQSQPVLRNISTARISYGRSMVHPQFCITLGDRIKSCWEFAKLDPPVRPPIGCIAGEHITCRMFPDQCCM